MIKINGTDINKVMVNDNRISSVYVNKLDTGKKYFVHYDTTIEIVHNNDSVGVNIDNYGGYKLGFFMEKHKTGNIFNPTGFGLRNFTIGPGGNFTVDFSHTYTDVVGYILFMHPFATTETIEKYKQALKESWYEESSGVGQMMMDYNFEFLKKDDNYISTKFFKDAGISEDVCNEECFGMVVIRGFGNWDFQTNNCEGKL